MDNKDQKQNLPLDIDPTDEDIYGAMKDIPGYLDITPGDLKELYRLAYRHAYDRVTGSVTARDIMTKDVITVSPGTALPEVAAVMAAHGISGLPVVNDDGTVAGVISEKDFLSHMHPGKRPNFMAVIAECLKGRGCLAAPARTATAKDIMKSPALTVGEAETVREIAQLFAGKKINRVPVIDGAGRICGIVTRNDIIRASGVREQA